MADRFPALDDIPSGQADAQGDAVTSADDFLARERALLGDDADTFASLNDDLKATTVEDGDDDLLGATDQTTNGAQDHLGTDGMGDFESSFPAIQSGNEAVGPGGTITGSSAPFLSGPTQSYGATTQEEEEPDVIKQWRERRDLAISHRDEVSAKRKAETIKTAQMAVDDFYENYNTKKEKIIAQTRKEAEEFLASREDTVAGGTSWERIAKLIDLSGKGARGGASGTGKERFRELLLDLKKDQKAPGATGY